MQKPFAEATREHRILISIAGITVELLDSIPAPAQGLSREWEPFLGAMSSDIAATMTIRRDPQLPFGPRDHIGFAGPAGAFQVHGWDFVATREHAAAAIEVHARPTAGLAGLLRWLYSVLLLERDGLLVHAASSVIWGRGVIWAGPARSGKTTLASLIARRCTVLTDEATAVRFDGVEPRIYATPFFGELGPTAGAACSTLHSVFFLRHGNPLAVERLDRGSAAIRMRRAVFPPCFQRPWSAAAQDRIDRIVAAVPAYDLGFAPTPALFDRLTDLRDQL